MGSLLILSSLTSGIILFFESRSRTMVHGPAILLAVLPLPLSLILFGFILGLILLIVSFTSYHNALYLYENGFIIRNGRHLSPWAWSEINRFDAARIKKKIARQPFKEQYVIHITAQSGRQLTLHNQYQQFETLLQHLRSKIVPTLYAKAIQQLSHHKPIQFHPDLQVTSQGIQFKNRTYAWKQVEPPKTTKGLLILSLKGNGQPLFKSKFSKIWNLDLLLTLLETPPEQ